MRPNPIRLDDFRTTIKEMFDADQHDVIPYDKREHDSEFYGRRNRLPSTVPLSPFKSSEIKNTIDININDISNYDMKTLKTMRQKSRY